MNFATILMLAIGFFFVILPQIQRSRLSLLILKKKQLNTIIILNKGNI